MSAQAKGQPSACARCNKAQLVRLRGSPLYTGMTVMSAVPVDAWACTHCGFVEQRVAPAGVRKLKDRQLRKP